MTTISFKTSQAVSTTDGAATTLVTTPVSHEYIGTVGCCYVASSGASTVFSLAVTTGGAATSKNYRAYLMDLEVGETKDFTVTLDAGKILSLASAVGNVAAQFHYQDRDNS